LITAEAAAVVVAKRRSLSHPSAELLPAQTNGRGSRCIVTVGMGRISLQDVLLLLLRLLLLSLLAANSLFIRSSSMFAGLRMESSENAVTQQVI
jgi:hypothetical protein